MASSEVNLNNIDYGNTDNILNWKPLLDCILRRKKLTLSISSSVLFLFFCYAFLTKPTWKGQFKIVLNQNKQSSVTNTIIENIDNSTVKNLLGSSFGNTANLNTEVEILKSQSVLMPVFNYVKEQRELKGKNNKNFTFMKWKKNVNVALKSRTSVLEVSYKDTNKDIIFPVITKISKAYKAYPGRDKNKSLLEAIDYFNKQILLYRDKSEKAYRDYLSYSLENDLKTIPNITNINVNTNNKENNNPVKNIDIDPRILIQNQIKEIEFEINEIKSVDLSNYDDRALPMFFEVPEVASNSLVNVVNRKVIKLSDLRAHFNENDRQILELKQNIKDLNKVIHSNMIEYLSTEIRNLNSRLKLVSKPKEVVIKFKELQRDLIRLETILTNLENNKQVVSLQLAEKTNPWDLISTPILNDSQVAPNKKQVVLLGLIASILLGIASAIYADKFSGLIYSSQELKSIFKFNFLNIVDLNKDWEEGISLIARNINNELKIKSLGIIMTKENDNYQEKIIQNLAKSMDNVNIVTSNKLTDLDICENIILLVQQGKTKRDELFEINQNLKLLNKPLLGLIFINSILKI